MTGHAALECPFEDLLAKVCRKWPLLVIATVGNGERRFVELMDDLRGISPRSLTQVLEDLTELKLLERKRYREVPPRVGYKLTPSGKELRDAAKVLLQWASTVRPERGCPILAAIKRS